MWTTEERRAYYRDRYTRLRAEKIQELGGKCIDCGTADDLEFDHADASSKRFEISRIITYSAERLYAELGKCVLRCAPCHREKSRAETDHAGGHNRIPADEYHHGTTRMYQYQACRCEMCVAAKRLYRAGKLKMDELVTSVAA